MPEALDHAHDRFRNRGCVVLVAQKRKMVRCRYDQEAVVGRDVKPIVLLGLVPFRALAAMSGSLSSHLSDEMTVTGRLPRPSSAPICISVSYTEPSSLTAVLTRCFPWMKARIAGARSGGKSFQSIS
jgi:hypothetical protein